MKVLLLHAFPLDPEMWAPQLEVLRRHEVHAPSLYGLGESVESWAEALAEPGDSRVCLVGASMGGYTALALAQRFGQRTAGLLVVGCYTHRDQEAQLRWREKIATAADRGGAEGVWKAMLPTLFSSAADPVVVARARAACLRQDPAGLATAMRALRARPDARTAVRALRCPVIVGVGADDPAVTVAETVSLAGQASNGRHIVFEGSGHLPNLERQRAFNEALAGLIEEAGHAASPSG